MTNSNTPRPSTPEAIRARLDKASRYPWRMHGRGGNDEIEDADGNNLMDSENYYPSVPGRFEDWLFIANAPMDIAYLLARVETLEQELREARALYEANHG